MGPERADEYLKLLGAIRYEPVGYVERVVISVAHDEHRYVPGAKVVPGVGVQGDHAWKRWWRGKRIEGREVSAMNAEVLDALEVAYDVPGDNLIVRGFNLGILEAGDMVRVGDLILKATGERYQACATFEQRTSFAKKEAVGHERFRGTMLDAIEEGYVHVGDTVERIFLKATTVGAAGRRDYKGVG